MGAFQGRQVKNDPFSNTYNPGWRNHPNFSWRDQGANRQAPPPGFQQQRQVLPPQQQNIPDRKTFGGRDVISVLSDSKYHY